MSEFGKNLKSLMRSKNLTANDLSKVINVPLKSVQEWIRKNRFPRDPEIIRKISEHFHCSAYWLMFGIEDPHTSAVGSLLQKMEVHAGTYEIVIRRIHQGNPAK